MHPRLPAIKKEVVKNRVADRAEYKPGMIFNTILHQEHLAEDALVEESVTRSDNGTIYSKNVPLICITSALHPYWDPYTEPGACQYRFSSTVSYAYDSCYKSKGAEGPSGVSHKSSGRRSSARGDYNCTQAGFLRTRFAFGTALTTCLVVSMAQDALAEALENLLGLHM
ncbi:hypothetical protein MMC26_004232 [Xylographa opegraphella]|nr:hypothetical protein [Xylographa opegraphella]